MDSSHKKLSIRSGHSGSEFKKKNDVNDTRFLISNRKDAQNLKKFSMEFFHLNHKIDPSQMYAELVL